MQRKVIATLLGLLCMSAVAVPASALTKPRRDVRAEVNRLHRAYHRAVALHQPGAVANLYAQEGWYLPPTCPALHGPAAIRRHFVTLFRRDGLCAFTATTRKLRVGGSLVVDFVRYRTSLCRGGKVTRVAGPGVLVYRLQPGGGLKILYDIFTLDRP